MLLVIGISPILIGSILTLRNGQKAIEEITFNQLEAINNLKIEELNNWFESEYHFSRVFRQRY